MLSTVLTPRHCLLNTSKPSLLIFKIYSLFDFQTKSITAADPGGGGGGKRVCASVKFDLLCFIKIQFCIKMVKNKAQIAQESI